MKYINIRIPVEDALEMLIERVCRWTNDEEAIEMYRQMYEAYLCAGVFDGGEFDVDTLVDNDYHNDCSFVEEGEEGWTALLEYYRKNGLGDCEYIEAVNNEDNPTCFLVRY